MRNHQNAIRGWNNMINNAISAESRIKTSIISPEPTEKLPTYKKIEKALFALFKINL